MYYSINLLEKNENSKSQEISSNNLTKNTLVIPILQRQPNDEQYVIMVLNYKSSNTDVCSLYSSTALYLLQTYNSEDKGLLYNLLRLDTAIMEVIFKLLYTHKIEGYNFHKP